MWIGCVFNGCNRYNYLFSFVIKLFKILYIKFNDIIDLLFNKIKSILINKFYNCFRFLYYYLN